MLHLPPTRRRGPPAVGRWSSTYLTPAHLAGGWEVEQGHTPSFSPVAGGREVEQGYFLVGNN